MPQNKSTAFLQPVVFTLYSYASHPREGYLLLQLFKAALQEEIRWGSGGGITLTMTLTLTMTMTLLRVCYGKEI